MEDEINFGGIKAPQENETGKELGLDDFKGGSYLKNPAVGDTLILDIVSVQRSDKTKAKNKTSGAEFSVGLKTKSGDVNRYDIHCVGGIYTVSNWEIFFKLFGNDGLLLKYAKEHNGSFAGAKISIFRNIDGGYGSTKLDDLAKILGKSVPEAKEYQDKIKIAIKEQRLFDVKII